MPKMTRIVKYPDTFFIRRSDRSVETGKANGLEPYEYLRHVLMHIAGADTVEMIEALLPWNVKTKTAQ